VPAAGGRLIAVPGAQRMEDDAMLRYLFLFLHVSSAMGVFAALGIEAAALFQLRRAHAAADLRAALGAYQLVRPVGAISLLGILVSGIYLATTAWQWRGAWIGLGFLGLVIVAGIGGVATRRGLARVERAANGAGGVAGGGRGGAILRASLRARVAILVGVVYLMTVKPRAGGALAVSIVALAIALVAGALALRGGGAAAAGARTAAP
jgi:hypothetical protein